MYVYIRSVYTYMYIRVYRSIYTAYYTYTHYVPTVARLVMRI